MRRVSPVADRQQVSLPTLCNGRQLIAIIIIIISSSSSSGSSSNNNGM